MFAALGAMVELLGAGGLLGLVLGLFVFYKSMKGAYFS